MIEEGGGWRRHRKEVEGDGVRGEEVTGEAKWTGGWLRGKVEMKRRGGGWRGGGEGRRGEVDGWRVALGTECDPPAVLFRIDLRLGGPEYERQGRRLRDCIVSVSERCYHPLLSVGTRAVRRRMVEGHQKATDSTYTG